MPGKVGQRHILVKMRNFKIILFMRAGQREPVV